jgi:hypothetical protein
MYGMKGPIIKVAPTTEDEDEQNMKLAFVAVDLETSKGQEGGPIRMKYDDGFYTIGVMTAYDLIVGENQEHVMHNWQDA